jgi:hypothetical protein
MYVEVAHCVHGCDEDIRPSREERRKKSKTLIKATNGGRSIPIPISMQIPESIMS